jgi:hypothetical protein
MRIQQFSLLQKSLAAVPGPNPVGTRRLIDATTVSSPIQKLQQNTAKKPQKGRIQMLQMSQRLHASPITRCRIEIHPIIEHITTAQLKNFAFQTPESGITEPIKTAYFQTCTFD